MSIASILDFLASVAILAMLADGYGTVRRRLVGVAVAPVVLGVLFGIVAIVEMARPFEPFEGVLIDLRNIPIALAGAFLGWRGLLPAMAIAIYARFEFGGVGTLAGVSGIVIAGLAGMIWARKMAHHHGRSFAMLLCLSLAMSAHLLSAVVMPRELALWFFTNAAGPLLAANLLCVTFIGWILEQENRRVSNEIRLARAAHGGVENAPLRGPAFVHAVKSVFAAKPFGDFAGFLIIGPQKGLLAKILCGVLPGMVPDHPLPPLVLDDLVEHRNLIGQSADGRLFIPLSEAEVVNSPKIVQEIRTNWRAHYGENSATRWTHLYFDARILKVRDPAQFFRIVAKIANSHQEDWPSLRRIEDRARKMGLASGRREAELFNPVEHNALFAKADFLMDRTDP